MIKSHFKDHVGDSITNGCEGALAMTSSPHRSSWLNWLMWLARQVSLSSLTAPCSFLQKVHAQLKRMTFPDRGWPSLIKEDLLWSRVYKQLCSPATTSEQTLKVHKFPTHEIWKYSNHSIHQLSNLSKSDPSVSSPIIFSQNYLALWPCLSTITPGPLHLSVLVVRNSWEISFFLFLFPLVSFGISHFSGFSNIFSVCSLLPSSLLPTHFLHYCQIDVANM